MNERGFSPHQEREGQKDEKKRGLTKKEVLSIATIVATLGLVAKDTIQHSSTDEGGPTKDTATEQYQAPAVDSVPGTQFKARKTATASERPDTLKENLDPERTYEEITQKSDNIFDQVSIGMKGSLHAKFKNADDSKTHFQIDYGVSWNHYELRGFVHDQNYEYTGRLVMYPDSTAVLTHLEIRRYISPVEDERPEFAYQLQLEGEDLHESNPRLRAHFLELVNTELDAWEQHLDNAE